MDYPHHITLEWIAENKQSVYVRNITRPRGQIAVNFVHPSGNSRVEKIPRTHLPVCLSDRLSYDTILGSDDLRALLVKGILELVPEDVAKEELVGEDAMSEVNQLTLSQYSAKQSFISERVKEMEDTVDRNIPREMPQELGIDTQVINPRILSLVQKLESQDISVKAAISELKTMEGELRDTDCSYILKNVPKKGQIKTYVNKVLEKLMLAALDNTDDADDDDLTPEEKAQEMQRESIARQHQHV